jgi:cell division protein FtsL
VSQDRIITIVSYSGLEFRIIVALIVSAVFVGLYRLNRWDHRRRKLMTKEEREAEDEEHADDRW